MTGTRKIWMFGAALTLVAVFCGALFSTAVHAHAAEPSSVLAETYTAQTQLVDPPTVVCDVNSAETLEKILSSVDGERPSNAILRMDAAAQIVDEYGTVFGGFGEIYKKIEGKIIPVVSVSTQAEADALVSFLTEEIEILDIAVLGAPDLVKSVRERCPTVRGIIRVADMGAYECVKTASVSRAGTILLPLKEATYDTVTYIQSRFKAVWTEAGDEMDVRASVTSGAYGIVAEDFSLVYDVYGTFPPTHARMPFNVAHRGLPTTHNENSVSGTRAAIEAGATHVELDGMLTTDGEIVMMHDDGIARTSDGTGNIESMTLEQVKRARLDLFEPREEIPTLQEIIPLFEDSDAVLVFEIKSKGTDIVTRLKEILDETDFYEHIVVIAFGYPALERMQRELPEVPTADLNRYTEENFANMLPTLGKYNCAISTNGSSTKRFNENYLRDRGIIGWYWTQENEASVDAAFEKGLMGLTNNVGAYFGGKEEIFRVVRGDAIRTDKALSAGDEIDVMTVRYNGEMELTKGTVGYLADRGGYYDVIAKYDAGEIVYFTPVFRVEKAFAATEERKETDGGCASALSPVAWGVLSAVLLLAAPSVILIKRRKG